MSSKKVKIGLALGSGGAKGIAHIGVIKMLEENKIPIDYIAGSSIGALIGGAYSSTKDIYNIESEVVNSNWKKIFSLIDPAFKGGLIGGTKVKKFIENYTGKKDFQDLQIPFLAVATDISNGEGVVIDKGEVAGAIRASISFPLLFKPVNIDGQTLSDGGLSMPVPVSVVRKMGADIVIAVNLDDSYFEKKSKSSFYKIANSSINILRYHLAKQNVESADIVISPQTGNVSWGKFADGRSVIKEGERATSRKINTIKKLINKK